RLALNQPPKETHLAVVIEIIEANTKLLVRAVRNFPQTTNSSWDNPPIAPISNSLYS
ncbi:MAG: hypothetical protein RLY14_1402, partial [Planctomycetota bacterium]